MFLDNTGAGAAASHNDEVETLTVYRGPALEQYEHAHGDGECSCLQVETEEDKKAQGDEGRNQGDSVAREDLLAALSGLSKESVWRVKGFVKLKGEGVYILNWAFGRFELTEMQGDFDGTIRLTVMGERGEVRRAIKRFCTSLDSRISRG